MIVEIQGALLAILAAIFLAPLAPLTHIMLMRVFKHKQRPFGFLVVGCLVYGLALLVADFYLNGFFEPGFWEEMLSGFSTVTFVCLGYGEAFSMVYRGFSLRILTDIYLKKSSSLDQVASDYGGGQGLDWMLQKRISGMEGLGAVRWKEEELIIGSNFWFRFGKFGIWFKNFFNMGLGG